jgi:hypothetical protein
MTAYLLKSGVKRGHKNAIYRGGIVMERMWSEEAFMKYLKQWIVMVNISTESNNRTFGDIVLVTPDEDEAYAKAKEIGDSMGGKLVFEGFNDTPQIGGLEICYQ